MKWSFEDNDKVAVFDAEEIENAVRRVSLMADERTRSIRMQSSRTKSKSARKAPEKAKQMKKSPWLLATK